jgi:hypothetical protein
MGESLAPLVLEWFVRRSFERLRRPRVRTTRSIVLPQKQVGSAQFGVGPIIRNRICARQNRFGHSHNSSRLFFTNEISARFNAPRRCTYSLRAPSPCRRALPTEGVPTEMVHCRLFGSLLTDFPKKHALRSRLRPAAPRLVFIPNSRFSAAAGYAQYRLLSGADFRLGRAFFRTRSALDLTRFQQEKRPDLGSVSNCDSIFTST